METLMWKKWKSAISAGILLGALSGCATHGIGRNSNQKNALGLANSVPHKELEPSYVQKYQTQDTLYKRGSELLDEADPHSMNDSVVKERGTSLLCQAAFQNYAPAQYRLAMFYAVALADAANTVTTNDQQTTKGTNKNTQDKKGKDVPINTFQNPDPYSRARSTILAWLSIARKNKDDVATANYAQVALTKIQNMSDIADAYRAQRFVFAFTQYSLPRIQGHKNSSLPGSVFPCSWHDVFSNQ